MSPFNLKEYLADRKHQVETAIEAYLPGEKVWPYKLHEAMLYSLRAGGKRLRPILVIAACEAVGGKIDWVLPVACALEMIHTYSLIHDDLPAMDDDDLRRGKPTNHKIFGEAIAILAGDALLTEAFRIMTRFRHPQIQLATLLEVVEEIADASGSQGMAGGQVADLESEHQQISLQDLERLHRHKTGRLIKVSLEAGAKLANANAEQLSALSKYGECIGLAFQIADDILDIEGGEEIGKDVGSDLEKDKATYPRLMGMDESKKLAKKLIDDALDCLKIFDEKAEPLRALALYIIQRKN